MNRIHLYLILVTADLILLLTAITAAALLEYDAAYYAFLGFGELSLFIAILAALDDYDRSKVSGDQNVGKYQD